jgi:hypothetical protein
MNKMKPAMLAAALAGGAIWALAAMVTIPDQPTTPQITSSNVDTFELMSVSKGLPAQRYEAF